MPAPSDIPALGIVSCSVPVTDGPLTLGHQGDKPVVAQWKTSSNDAVKRLAGELAVGKLDALLPPILPLVVMRSFPGDRT